MPCGIPLCRGARSRVCGDDQWHDLRHERHGGTMTRGYIHTGDALFVAADRIAAAISSKLSGRTAAELPNGLGTRRSGVSEVGPPPGRHLESVREITWLYVSNSTHKAASDQSHHIEPMSCASILSLAGLLRAFVPQ